MSSSDGLQKLERLVVITWEAVIRSVGLRSANPCYETRVSRESINGLKTVRSVIPWLNSSGRRAFQDSATTEGNLFEIVNPPDIFSLRRFLRLLAPMQGVVGGFLNPLEL